MSHPKPFRLNVVVDAKDERVWLSSGALAGRLNGYRSRGANRYHVVVDAERWHERTCFVVFNRDYVAITEPVAQALGFELCKRCEARRNRLAAA